MFGRAIYDFAIGERKRTQELLLRKRCAIERCGASTYVETSHALLKSWFDVARDFFPQLKLVHLIRDPLKVAKSETHREAMIKGLHIPLCHYRGGDGKRYFVWSLTGLEPIFKSLDASQLTRFQWYIVQWIEIENRAQQYLETPGLETSCLTLRSPYDLTNAGRIRDVLRFLELAPRRSTLNISGRTNRNWRPTVIDDRDRQEFFDVLSRLPAKYLEIFRREPYVLREEESFQALAGAARAKSAQAV